jgi:hypothetical protein
MLTTSKVKWFRSISLASILLILAIIGGKWGTDYSAKASVIATPIINNIIPVMVPMGSPDTEMVIYGSNFEPAADTKVWISNNCYSIPGRYCNARIFTPVDISPTQINILIPADMLEEPAIYIVQVVIYVGATVPANNYSNPALFFVWSPNTYYPLMFKDALVRTP